MTTPRQRSRAQMAVLQRINERRRTNLLLKDGFTMNEIRGGHLAEIRFANQGMRELRKYRRQDIESRMRRGMTRQEAIRATAANWQRVLAEAGRPGNRILDIIYS